MQAQPATTDDAGFTALAADLEGVRTALGIPGMAAAVVGNGELAWSAGFGFADVENQIEATAHTPFGLASVTKPIAAAVVMQLVEAGLIDLDALVSDYGVDMPSSDGVTVRHLLTHTSEGTPGAVHNYNGNRYGYLGGVIEGATGRTFSDLLGEQVLVPLGMTDTAMNPLNSWGGTSLEGLEEFGRTLGWGESFEHYPDVYDRLAKPYQFDDDYGIIPGKYHLVHNPAAGGISSVTDLAKFDIGLDSGALLSDSVRVEMLSPAVPTVPGRADLAYGLGWYVQDFEGLRLNWHAGRWPPSTSALYLKIPELDLTFIALANTDNLTVPFPGIGSGDVSKSLLALTFFRHFVFPSQHGTELPAVDWLATEGELAARLSEIEDEATQVAIERELWAYRRALASSGQTERARALAAAARQAFPGSPMRFQQAFTQTAGRTAIEAPLPSARSFGFTSKLIMVWLVLIALSLLGMLVRLARSEKPISWESAMWLTATLLVGPVAVATHWMDKRRGDHAPMERAACAALFAVAGYSVAWTLAVTLLMRGDADPNPFATLGATIFLPILVGLLAVRSPLLARSSGATYRRASRRGILAEVITWALGLAVFFPLTLYVDNRWLSTIPHPTSPYFGGMISVMALVGLLVLLPLHLLMDRRGFTVWPSPAGGGSDAGLSLPTMRNSWWLLLATLATMIAAIAIAVSWFGQ